MKIRADGSIQFATIKEIVDYIRGFRRIECERDVSTLEEVALSADLLTYPIVEDDEGELTVTEGDLDEGRLLDCIEESQEGIPGFLPPHAENGIVLTVHIGGLEFEKNGYGWWRVVNCDALKKLPDGYSEDELIDELDNSDSSQCAYDLISTSLDDAVDVDEQYCISYRMFQSAEDDIDTVRGLLMGLDYEGFYAEPYEYEWPRGVQKKGHRVYGFREKDWTDRDSRPELIDVDTATRYLAESVGWISE